MILTKRLTILRYIGSRSFNSCESRVPFVEEKYLVHRRGFLRNCIAGLLVVFLLKQYLQFCACRTGIHESSPEVGVVLVLEGDGVLVLGGIEIRRVGHVAFRPWQGGVLVVDITLLIAPADPVVFLYSRIGFCRVGAEELRRGIEIILVTIRTIIQLRTIVVLPCHSNFLWFPITGFIVPIEIRTIVIKVLVVSNVIYHSVNRVGFRIYIPPFTTC